MKNWTIDRLDDQTGKTFLITGGNAGLGYEAAAHLRRANATVLIGSRVVERGAAAAESLGAIDGVGDVHVVELDLADTSSIRAANDAIRDLTDGLDALVNNAGIMQTPQQQTADGFELQFGTNHLGHFLLNALTFDLVSARSGRIVPVSSLAHRGASGIQLDDPMLTEDYSPTRAYSHSKLANLVYGLELARRLDAAGSAVMSVSAHPGYSATNLQSTGPTGLFKQIYKVTNAVMAQSASDGALPEVFAAASDDARNGGYYGPQRFGEARGPVGDSRISDAARDEAAGAGLWQLSEELLGVEFDVTAP